MTLFKRPSSVKGALLAMLLPAGIGLMAVAWLVHGFLLDRMSRDFIENRLMEEVAFLELRLREADGVVDELKTGDYFKEVFHHAFAVHSPTTTVISPEYWRPLLEPLIESEKQGSIRVLNKTQDNAPADILAYRRSLDIKGIPIVVIVSEDMDALRLSQAELHAWTAVVSMLLIGLLAGVIWLGISFSMRPAVNLQAALRQLQTGEISRIDLKTPEEFRPLVQQLNQLLDSLDQRLERSRDALANLSHSVKTPIAAVRQVLEDTNRPLDNPLRQQMGVRLGDIDKQLEAEMRRSRFAGPQVGKSAYPVKQARDLLWMLGRLYPEKTFELSTSLAEESRWPVEEHDLNEILGNLLDNAGKWSANLIELSLEQTSQGMQVTVRDDGRGVDSSEITRLGQRGLRLDEQTPGHGLGLAIVRDVVARYDGRISFVPARTGGLQVQVEIFS
jgi:signal transduction histidine kinase